MVHHDKRRHTQCKNFFLYFFLFFQKIFFLPIFEIVGLQVQDKPERTSPSRPARKKMVVDLVGWSQGAHNAEK